MYRLTKWVDVYGDGELEVVQTVKTVAQEELNGTLNVVNVDNWRQILGKLAAYEDLGTVEELAARVEVVRCGGCANRHDRKWCSVVGYVRHDDEYCSYGERRED